LGLAGSRLQLSIPTTVEEQMNNKNEFVSMVGLWVTLIASMVILLQQLASNGLLG
jgi:hypothetical protein